jgi:hypothetical protein
MVLGRRWGLAVAWMDYRAVGFGSHHWEIVDSQQGRWFVTVDELECKGHSQGEPENLAFQRLRAALRTASDLRDNGCIFVVAPVLTLDLQPLVEMNGRWGVALYPYVEGDSFAWGEFSTAAHRRGVLDLIVELHGAPPAASRHALVDDFAIPNRDVLELGCRANGDVWDGGPYGVLTSTLLLENAEGIRRLLVCYDDLVKQARRLSRPMVLTHGEPHPGNTLLTPDGWLLIDWDTVLVAPPERDLWSIDPGDGSVLGAYVVATGVTPLPAMLDLYRLRWDLADIAISVRQFRGTHSGTVDDEKSWEVLSSLLAKLARGST